MRHVKLKYQNPLHKKDSFTHNEEVGKLDINLGTLPHELTVDVWKNFEENSIGKIHLFITISGFNDLIQNCIAYQPNFHDYNRLPIFSYGLEFVGKLRVTIHGASGLKNVESPETFCIISLHHQYRQTQTINKSFAPIWRRHFEFNVQDACDCVNISVLHEQKDKKHRLLGRLKIPLLQISDSLKKWYQLKDNDLRTEAKGDEPKIHLQFSFSYNAGNVLKNRRVIFQLIKKIF